MNDIGWCGENSVDRQDLLNRSSILFRFNAGEIFHFIALSLLSSFAFLKIIGHPAICAFTSKGEPHVHPAHYLARNDCVSKRTITIILVGYLTIIWAAVIFRIDYFPLTWVPMYSSYYPDDTITAKVWDKDRISRGLLVTHRDGSTSYLSHKDLNIPKPNFRRLYYQRMFGSGPPKHRQGDRNLSQLNRLIRGLEEGESNYSVDWEWRMFWSLNKTLGYEPPDPRFVVKAEALYQIRMYRKDDLVKQDVSKVRTETMEASIEWKDEWITRWKHGTL